jgi:elongation factor Ts
VAVDVATIKKLRDMTGAGMMDAKGALEESGGDVDKAVEVLRKKGAAGAAKRADREAKAGMIASYTHGDKIGVLVEVNCETDFVARTDDFRTFARDIAMHVAATSPEYLSPEEVPAEVTEKERKFYAEEAADKPENVREKIIAGKLAKYYEQICLLKQPFVKDPDKSVEQLVTEISAKTGENIVVRRFARLELGDVG